MATKSRDNGRYICKVGFYDIYAKDTIRPKRDGGKSDVASTDYLIVHAKKVVEKGFKTKDMAVERAKSLTK